MFGRLRHGPKSGLSAELLPMMPAPSMAVRAAPAATTPDSTPAIAGSVAIGLDSSSPEAFIRSVAPYAARVSKATGIPAEALIGMACNETGYGRYAPHNNLFGIKGTGPDGSFSTPTWEDYGNGPVTITDNFRAYHSPAESFLDFADLITTSPRYKGAAGQTTVEGFVNVLRQGGYMTDPDYVNKISAITNRYSSVIQQSLAATGTTSGSAGATANAVSNSDGVFMSARASAAASARPGLSSSAASSAVLRPGQGVVVPDQFHVGLPPDEAYAACGPVAAVAFAQIYGRNPTPAEAMALAKQSGWTAEGGMNGISNEKRLLDKMGLPAQLEMGANWDHIRASALQHQPVILSTPGHYYVIDGYDANTGAYHVGQSGKAYRGGSDWLTPGQIEGLSGAPSGALFTVQNLAGGSPVSQPPRQVLPPQQDLLTPQREVLPPLELGNTPVTPQIAPAPAPAPGPTPAPAPPPVTPAPPPVAPAAPPVAPEPSPPPPADATIVPPPDATIVPPPVVAPAPVVAAPPAPPVVPPPPPAPVTPPQPPPVTVVPPPAAPAPVAEAAGPVAGAYLPPAANVAEDPPTLIAEAPPPSSGHLPTGLAAGAVVVGGAAQRPTPPPPPPRRRPEDEDLDPR